MIRTAHVSLVFLLFMLFMPEIHLQISAQEHMPKDIRQKYPQDKYIVRSGNGESSESASESARFEIVKYFEAKISGATLINQWAKSQTTRGKTTEDRFTKISNTMMVSASREIPGIDIASINQDKKSDSYEAWAVLKKSTYSAFLSDRIKKIDSLVDFRLSNLKKNDLYLVKTYSQIMSDILLREQARQDLSLLDSGLMVGSNEILLNMVMTSLDSLIAEAFDVGLVFNGEVNNKIKAGIRKGISDAGIRIKEYKEFQTAVDEGNDMVISVEHESSSRSTSKTFNKKEFKFFFTNWVLSLNAIDPETQEVIDSFVKEDQTNGSYEDQANQRMITRILQKNVPLISNWVYDLIFKPKE